MAGAVGAFFVLEGSFEVSTYKIVRFYRDSDRRDIVATGLTLDEAQAHCHDDESSSSTAAGRAARERTECHGPWFDGFTEEGGTGYEARTADGSPVE